MRLYRQKKSWSIKMKPGAEWDKTKCVVLARMWGKSSPHTLLVGMQAGTTTLEKNLEAS
jgi:hypothetical protein